MTERIKNKLNINVTSTTFHKLGLDIIKYSQNFRPNVYDDLSIFIHNFFEKEIVNHPELTKNLIEYFAYYLELPEEIDESKSLGEIYEKEKSADLETLKSKYEKANYIKNIDNEKKVERITLKGEHVKSIEETKIANFFFLNGINYEYEKDYPYKNDDLNYKIYQPDFYLTDYDIYLEHFGIDENGKLPWLSEVEEKKYLDGIEWKREFHKKNGTKLIETYSYYCSKGILQEKLIALMKENNISLKQPDFLDIFDKIYASKSEKYFNEFIKLCSTFITLFKSNNYDLNTITLLQKNVYQNQKRIKAERNLLFLEIIKIILEKYNSFLENNNLIDFSDMINLATKNVNNGFILHKYKYVIVDEFQDISNSRFLLLKSIVDSTDAKLFCVGDDWQSIYRFAGSDISLFTQFEKYFGYTKILKIEKTYRNSQELIDVASDFISRNPFQLNKELVSDKHLKFPLVFWAYTDFSQTLEKILNKIILNFGQKAQFYF